MTRPPARCNGCQDKRVAWVTPRVDYCYDCLPGGPFVAPTCRTCASTQYFSEGLCETCHPGGPSHLGTCRGCLAWGVSRERGRCWVCRWWQGHYPHADCHYCGRTTPVGEWGACRLCLEQARLAQEPGRALDFADANRAGQQLFFANLQFQRRRTPRLEAEPRRRQRTTFTPVAWRQLTLFELDPDLEVIRERALASDSELIRYCSEVVRAHAAAHGWSKRQRNVVVYSLRLLQVLQETPGAKINATDVLQLPRYEGNINSTLDVLDAAGLLIDDRTPHVERYFAAKTSNLPEPMRTQLEVWLEVMLGGSSVAPRQRSRDPQTARLQIMGIAPIMRAWAAAGHESLAEITSDDVRVALLSQRGAHRNFAEGGLRSLFKVLKGRKLVFFNPTRGMPLTPVGHSVPLPLDTEAIRQALNSPDPAVALAVALVAFHALTSKEVEKWWSFKGVYRTAEFTADLRVGGEWKQVVQLEDGNTVVGSGEFAEIDAPRKIVMTRRFDKHPLQGHRETTITYRFEPVATGTRVTVRDEGFIGRSEAAYGNAEIWEKVLGWLDAYLEADRNQAKAA